MAFTEDQKALIKEVAREVIKEYIPIIDERIELHTAQCSNKRYTSLRSYVAAAIVAAITAFVTSLFSKGS